MSTRRPVPPAGKLPEPYPGDAEMLERAGKDSLEQRAYIETSEALAKKAHDEALEALAAKRKAKKARAGGMLAAMLGSRHYSFINDNLIGVARTLAGNMIMQAGLLADILSDATDAYALKDNTDFMQSLDSLDENRAALADLLVAASCIKTAALERGQA